MITEDIKLTENYRLYTAVFSVDVPTTQSQPIESTQGTLRTTSAHRTPNPVVAEGESSAQKKSTVIRLRLHPRRSTRLTPPAPVPTVNEADDLILQDTLQVSLAEQKSHEEHEAKQNVELVKEHLEDEEIEKMLEGTEIAKEAEVDESTLRQDDKITDPGTRLEPGSAEDEYELKRREKGKNIEESRNTPTPTPIRSPRIDSNLISSDTEKL
ncbi:hypothetical protein Tco_0679567 [Tanacetum coccineum]|uniref:Uncharacterized protein n=1 Tax=Tanacetum coccineum TaxID=301880 RepID=A0ABQ4XJ60_9ASTR